MKKYILLACVALPFFCAGKERLKPKRQASDSAVFQYTLYLSGGYPGPGYLTTYGHYCVVRSVSFPAHDTTFSVTDSLCAIKGLMRDLDHEFDYAARVEDELQALMDVYQAVCKNYRDEKRINGLISKYKRTHAARIKAR